MRNPRFMVTGSMACGKSYTCGRLSAAAFRACIPCTVIEADRVRAEILRRQDQPVFKHVQRQLAGALGAGILDQDDAVNRARLSDLIFADPGALAAHDRIVLPVLRAELERRLDEARGLALLEWALAAEQDGLALADFNVLLVRCSCGIQESRLRGGDLTAEVLARRISSQLSSAAKEAVIRRAQAAAGTGVLLALATDETPNANLYADLIDFMWNTSKYRKEEACPARP